MSSREIRRVPMDWQHPKREDGSGYQPMLDIAYVDALKEWEKRKAEWEEDKAQQAEALSRGITEFEEWDSNSPDPAYYRSSWTDEQMENLGYCYYETTSEGTPLSPVLASPSEMVTWLVAHTHLSQGAAFDFVCEEIAPAEPQHDYDRRRYELAFRDLEEMAQAEESNTNIMLNIRVDVLRELLKRARSEK